MKNDLGSSSDFCWVIIIFGNWESTTSTRFPSILVFVIIGFGDNFYFIGDEISRVETNTELTDHRDISSWWESFHESFGTRFGDGTKIVDHFLFGHTDTSIPESEGIGVFVRDNSDSEIGF